MECNDGDTKGLTLENEGVRAEFCVRPDKCEQERRQVKVERDSICGCI